MITIFFTEELVSLNLTFSKVNIIYQNWPPTVSSPDRLNFSLTSSSGVLSLPGYRTKSVHLICGTTGKISTILSGGGSLFILWVSVLQPLVLELTSRGKRSRPKDSSTRRFSVLHTSLRRGPVPPSPKTSHRKTKNRNNTPEVNYFPFSSSCNSTWNCTQSNLNPRPVSSKGKDPLLSLREIRVDI